MAGPTLTHDHLDENAFVVQLGPVLELDEGIILRLEPNVDLDDHELFEFCQINRDLRIERDEQGEISIMAPAGGETGSRNAAVIAQLYVWAQKDNTGIAFDSSSGFRVGEKAMRSPDAAWVLKTRYEALSPKDRQEFPPLCPDFVVELRSSSDRLGAVRTKMERWMEHGARLGWHIDPKTRQVYIYRPNQQVEIVDDVASVSGEPVLPNFVLDLTQIW